MAIRSTDLDSSSCDLSLLMDNIPSVLKASLYCHSDIPPACSGRVLGSPQASTHLNGITRGLSLHMNGIVRILKSLPHICSHFLCRHLANSRRPPCPPDLPRL